MSTSRLGWVVGFTAMTIGYLWVIFHGFNYTEATIAYGSFLTGLKGWEKFLGYKYGNQPPPANPNTPSA